MPTIHDDTTRPKDRYDYERAVNPNTYLVLHLEPGLRDELYGFRAGTLEIFDAVAFKLVANVSREILGKTACRNRPRHRKRLPNIVSLEDEGGSPHLNIGIWKPPHVTFDHFEEVFRRHFAAEPWFRKGPSSFYCEPRTGSCVTYSLKRGARILERSISFCR